MSKKDKNSNKKKDILYYTRNSGAPVNNDTNSITIGSEGPFVLRNFHLLEKLGHFDRERTSERVVYAKGAGAHGYFKVTNCMKKYTKAKLFHKNGNTIQTFTRFSLITGSHGSADTARDTRGFAVRFYTDEGNIDILGNHIPIFFIRDIIKYPDLIHALKPAPNNNIPNPNNFWDYMSLTPESTNMLIYLFSDLGTIKSYRTIEGFGVNTFVWVNEDGDRSLIRYHWKPLLGVKCIDNHEALMLAGLDPDVATKDLYDTLERGEKVEYDLYVQIMDIHDKDNYSFDPEDPTKIWPEDLIPPEKVGRLVLDRNPYNYFQETEQIAFSPTNILPGIEFSNDKLLQGRSLPYVDSQFHRIGPNFAQLPINIPRDSVNNNEQNGAMRYFSRPGKVNYYPNSLDNGNPHPTPIKGKIKPRYVEGCIVREAIKKIDVFAQPGDKYRTMSEKEKEHLINNLVDSLSQVNTNIQIKAVNNFAKADKELGRSLKEELDIM